MKNTSDFLKMDLQLISIHRQSLIDANYVGCCDHCGRIIVNIATVKNSIDNKMYEIGLDCKKTLIDMPKIKQLIDTDPLFGKYNAKEFKKQTSDCQKWLLYLSQPERYNISFDYRSNSFDVEDLRQENIFGTMGKIIESENSGYLCKIGLKEFLQKCIDKKLIKID